MPEKKLYDLTVDSEFRDLIPPLNEEELKLLEESLVADGCESRSSYGTASLSTAITAMRFAGSMIFPFPFRRKTSIPGKKSCSGCCATSWGEEI